MTSTSERPIRRDAILNREAIVESAIRMLQTDPDAGFEAIAADAGLTRRAVYGHFATREALLDEVFSRGAARVAAAILPIDEADPSRAIALIGSRLWHEVSHVRTNASLALRDPFRARIAAVLQPVRDLLLTVVSDGIDTGVFRQDIDAAVLARLVEGSAIAVLDEASRSGLSHREGDRLVMLGALACVGVDWREAADLVATLLETTPEPTTQQVTTPPSFTDRNNN